MKRAIYLLIPITLLLLTFGSCKDQKDIYQEWVKKGGYIYPEKATGLTGNPGYNRVLIKWAYPKDPSVTHGTVYWNSRRDSLNFKYSDYAGQDSIRIYISNLSEQSYSFEVVNFDDEGNISVTAEQILSPYAVIWMSTHAERQINSAEMEGADAIISTGRLTSEMVATQYRYVTTDGDTVVSPELQTGTVYTATLPNAKVATRFWYRSAYCPSNGIDTLWNDWRMANIPIAGLIAPLDEWTVTTNVTNDNDPSLIFDGVIGAGTWSHGWRSTQNKYPKIVQIDLQKEYMLRDAIIYQNKSGTSMRTLKNVTLYISDNPFNMDASFSSSTYTSTESTYSKALSHWYRRFTNSTASWDCSFDGYYSVRYIAIVIFDSNRNGSAIQELELYGYEAPVEE